MAGGTDGYVEFCYTFSHEAYNDFYGNQDDDSCEWQGNSSVIQVPVDVTYESLGIKTVIENGYI